MLSKAFVILSLLVASGVHAEQLCDQARGATVIAQDENNTYLGKISNSYDSESIFNAYGTYGSEYSSLSIWNEYSTYGSEYSSYSATNSYTSTPPMIIKNRKILGYLSSNKSQRNSINPISLKAICEDEL